MTPDERTTAFSFRRQRLDGSAGSALEAIGAVVGVYSANPTGPLSIHVRAPAASPESILALDSSRATMRMRAMRTSAFVVPRAAAALVAAATAGPLERFAWMLRAAHVAPEELPAVRDAVLAAAAQPGTAQQLRSRVAIDGLDVGSLLSWLSLRGDIVSIGSGSLTSNASRYQARGAWLAGDPEPAAPEPAAARAWLAGEYLRAFGPARVADFAWWSGLNGRQAADAIAAHETVALDDGLLLRAEDLPEYEATAPLGGVVTLLPKWDAWTMGYPLDGRTRFLDRGVHDRVFDGDGNGLGMVLDDGRAVGAWVHRGAGTTMAVDLDPFERPSPRLTASLESAFGELAAFLGYRRALVRELDTVVPQRRRIRRPLD
ncbi:MAG TPA: crosslink repair DNA glycosylase YcaQ family protein [Candidatus Limnocylindrales bacterium]